jgi:nitroreductase
MEFEDAARSRRMIRTYQADRPVPRATIDEMLGLALRAPSAGHTQGWRFLVLDSAETVAAYWAVTTGDQPAEAADDWLRRLRSAPALVVVFASATAYLDRYAEPDKRGQDRDLARWAVPYWYVDAGMASLLLLLAATDRGLGACFFGVPGPTWPALRHRFGVPAEWEPVGCVSLGYPAPDRRSPSLRRGRRPYPETVFYQTMSNISS